MRQEVHLYIGDREVEFSNPPDIFYNYKETELKNPTIVKNSFSRSITIEGTPNNNSLFGHFWDLERYQLGGGGSGPAFSPIQKANFKLFVNGNLYEKGYCKLDSVTRTGNNCSYSITLYGNLGAFLESLNWVEGESNQKKTLADLTFRPLGEMNAAPLNLDFTINKETVDTAWRQLKKDIDTEKKWDVLNFAICAEGVPDDFEASKVLINRPDLIEEMTSQDGDYAGVIGSVISGSGFALGESRVDLTSDMTLDLRSYLLRPVVSVRSIFDALKLPENTGGWEVKLDDHFFDQQNPYYIDGWVTLSKLRDLGIEKVAQNTPSVTLSKQNYNWYNINYSTSLAKQTNFEFHTNLVVTGVGTTSATELWGSSNVKTDAQYHNSSEYVKEFEVNQSVFLQVVAYDSNGIEVARTNQIWCISETQGADYVQDYMANQGVDVRYGHFFKKSNKWIFCDRAGNIQDLKFTLPASTVYSTLKLNITTPRHYKYRLTKGWIDKKDTVNEPDYSTTPIALYTTPEDLNWSGLHTLDEAFAHNRVQGYYAFSSTSITLQMDDFDGFFSGTKIPAKSLLHTPYSPAEWLLSYCKLFNLYVFSDPTEESDDPDIYPQGVIHIMDRNTFYTDQYENIQDRIDRSKQMKINPTLAATKWYNFAYEDSNGELESTYKDKFGYSYGRQLLNTNLQFNNDTTELYESNIFKNGVMALEKCGYYMQPYYGVPVYVYDSFKYQLFKQSGSTYEAKDYDFPTKVLYTEDLNGDGLLYYDVMPKLQIHSEDNSAEDGSGILLFFNTFVNTQYAYNLTDDLPEMGTLCDSTPCWLLTPTPQTTDAAGNTIAIPRYSIPMFSRDIYESGVSGKIIHSWNFGHPQVTYVPYTYSTDFDCIYDKTWKDYLGDLYDVNTKSVTAYVRLQGKPNPAMLRKWYWFDNAIWRINEIKDWNIGSYDPTLVEFIKVQDTSNYALTKITRQGRIQITLNSYTLTNSAQTLGGRVICQNPSESWAFGDIISWEDLNGNTGYTSSPSPSQGTGTTNFSISVPSNSGLERTYKVTLVDSDDNRIFAYFKQEGDTTPYIDFAAASKNTTATTAGSQSYVLSYVTQNVRANSVSVSSNEPWCSATSIDTVNKTVTFSISATTMPNQRYATITINGIGTNGAVVNNQTHIYQTGIGLDVEPAEINFDYKDNSYGEVSVTTSIDWTATINDDNGE